MGSALDMTGKRFGRLVGISFNEDVSKQRGYRMWNFQCDCGKLHIARANGVNEGKTKSCGCLNRELSLARATKAPGVAALNSILYTYKYNAKRRGLSFDLSTEQFRHLISQNCHYCNQEPKECFAPNGKVNDRTSTIANGIDRVDSNIGYTIENTVPCCGYCNYIKHDKTQEEFLAHIKRIALWQFQ